jgi:hypothetical protein
LSPGHFSPSSLSSPLPSLLLTTFLFLSLFTEIIQVEFCACLFHHCICLVVPETFEMSLLGLCALFSPVVLTRPFWVNSSSSLLPLDLKHMFCVSFLWEGIANKASQR